MPDSKWSRERWAVLAVVLGALALRFYYFDWGLPFHYEEATPLKKAWSMGGWGTGNRVDLNPHFFNYPSLTIYLQFIAQKLLYTAMKFQGLVESGIDYHARYLADPSPFYHIGRAISVLFATATVWLVYRVGTRFAPSWAAIAAAGLMAVNTFHISRSHLIEVDVPLTFFVMLSFWLMLRAFERPARWRFALAGITIGLAASSKYTGVMLILPLAVTFVLAHWQKRDEVKWDFLPLGLASAMAVFALTSPYVLLDAATFSDHFAAERQHMRMGHFGGADSWTWAYYGRTLAVRLLGIPAVLLALAGLVYTFAVRRRTEALILGAFVIPYALAVSTWSMRADRYMLPILPVLLVFAATAVADALRSHRIARLSRTARTVAAALLIAAMAVPVTARYPSYLRSIKSDTRTTAVRWIESNIPSGSFLVIEPYGPLVLGPVEFLQASSPVRRKALEFLRNRPNYGTLSVPMFQVKPERSAVFYDHELYENADYIITIGAVRSRYEQEPERFREQIAFYDSLETGYRKTADFKPGNGGGSRIIVYKNPHHTQRFSGRENMAPPRPLRIDDPGSENLAMYFFYNLGANYEVFQHLQEAITCYDLAFDYPIRRPAWFGNLVMRKTQCLMMMKRRDEAVAYLDEMTPRSPTPAVRDHLLRLKNAIDGRRP